MSRGVRSSPESRQRIKGYINERLRATQSSVGLGRLRRGTVSVNTVADDSSLTTTGLVKVFTVFIPALNRTLDEVSLDSIRQKDPAATTTQSPSEFAVKNFNATSVGLVLFPKPDAIYSLSIDGLLLGSDMAANEDVPGMPEDFHDILVTGALADELANNDAEGAERMEKRFELRKRELRYFIAKSAYLINRANSRQSLPWWWVRVIP
jgi:hypothetical protein